MPIVAGGTSFMYHLEINGKRVTNLNLTGDSDREDLHRRDHVLGRPGDQGDEPDDRASRTSPSGR